MDLLEDSQQTGYLMDRPARPSVGRCYRRRDCDDGSANDSGGHTKPSSWPSCSPEFPAIDVLASSFSRSMSSANKLTTWPLLSSHPIWRRHKHAHSTLLSPARSPIGRSRGLCSAVSLRGSGSREESPPSERERRTDGVSGSRVLSNCSPADQRGRRRANQRRAHRCARDA